MASWTNIANVALDVGKPARAVDVLALRDNPIAIAEGRPGAPSVTPWAMARAPVVAGGTRRFRDPLTTYATSLSSVSPLRFAYAAPALMNDGTVRVAWTQGRADGVSSGGPETTIQRVRAGTATDLSGAIGNTNNAAQEAKTFDATIEPGDTIVWRFRTTSGGNTMQIYFFELLTDGGLLHPVPSFFTFGTAPA